MSLIFFPISIGFMSHVDFKKWQCRRVELKVNGPRVTKRGFTRSLVHDVDASSKTENQERVCRECVFVYQQCEGLIEHNLWRTSDFVAYTVCKKCQQLRESYPAPLTHEATS